MVNGQHRLYLITPDAIKSCIQSCLCSSGADKSRAGPSAGRPARTQPVRTPAQRESSSQDHKCQGTSLLVPTSAAKEQLLAAAGRRGAKRSDVKEAQAKRSDKKEAATKWNEINKSRSRSGTSGRYDAPVPSQFLFTICSISLRIHPENKPMSNQYRRNCMRAERPKQSTRVSVLSLVLIPSAVR